MQWVPAGARAASVREPVARVALSTSGWIEEEPSVYSESSASSPVPSISITPGREVENLITSTSHSSTPFDFEVEAALLSGTIPVELPRADWHSWAAAGLARVSRGIAKKTVQAIENTTLQKNERRVDMKLSLPGRTGLEKL